MKLHKLILLSCTSCIVFFLTTVTLIANQDTYQAESKDLVVEFMSHVEKGNYKQASDLFHYDRSFTEKQRRQENFSVQSSLRKHITNFGSFYFIDNFNPDGQVVGVGVTGAEIDYWQKHFEFIPQKLIPVNFSIAGKGFVKFGFCFTDKWEIQSVEFAIQISQKTKPIIDSINKQSDST